MLRASLLSFLRDAPHDLPLLVIATADVAYSALSSPLAYMFSSTALSLNPPDEKSRTDFFSLLLEDARRVNITVTERVVEELPKAPVVDLIPERTQRSDEYLITINECAIHICFCASALFFL